MSFDKKLKRISGRDWTAVSEGAIKLSAGLTLVRPGQMPAFELSDFAGLTARIGSTPKEGDLRVESIPGLGGAMLHEGIFMLHKSANVLVASHDQADSGLPTWSLPTAYQAALFAADAILKILGVAMLEVSNIAYVVDIWPQPDSSVKGKALARYQLGSEVQFVRHDRLLHFHKWAVLQRVLRTTTNLGLDKHLCGAILAIDEKDFARQRNDLHYAASWKFDDLHVYCSPINFLKLKNQQALISLLDPDKDEFSVVLATVLFSFGVSLVKSLASLSAVIDGERALLANACTSPRMKFRGAFENAGMAALT